LATIKDVAERAAVSIKTVSRFLSGYKGVSPRTAQKIEAAAEALEFFPSAAARSLRGEPSGIVSIIADNLTTTPFSFDIIKGVQTVCEKRGKLLLIGETRDQDRLFRQLVNRFREQKVEAIIKATFFHKPISIGLRFERCPLVLVNCFDEQGLFPSVVPDDLDGAYRLTRHLIKNGHKRIACIELPEDMVAAKLRRQGFIRAMTEAELKFEHQWLIPSDRRDAAAIATWLSGVLEALRKAPGRSPTAIMCANDLMAMRVIMRLDALGVRVPADISVVGYDDLQIISKNTWPALTTCTLPYFEMGERAATMALDLAKGTRESRRQVKCRGHVVVRESDRRLDSRRD
jgi:LacI family transcriptional regulator